MARQRSRSGPRRVRFAPGSARLRDAIAGQQRRLRSATAKLGAARVESIHDTRVAARRLRSLLKTYRPLLDPAAARLYRADLKRYAHALGAAREADVRSALLASLADADARITPAARRRLGAQLEGACNVAREQLERQVSGPEWAELCDSLERRRSPRSLVVDAGADIPQLLALVTRAWRRPLRLLRAEPRSVAELHELRLAFKHCRYALEPVADLAPRDAARLLRRLRAAQDRIGDHRDTLLAAHWVRDNGRTLGTGLAGRLDRELALREKDLRREATRRAARVLKAWEAWSAATRPLRKAAKRGRA